MTPTDPDSNSGGWNRLYWLVPAAPAIFGLSVGFSATPTPSGTSATSAFFPGNCSFLATHGFACPGCGVLSSFANMARLDLGAATYASPFGVMFFMLTCVLLGVCIWGGAKNKPMLDTLFDLGLDIFAGLLLGSMLVVWLVRVAKHFVL